MLSPGISARRRVLGNTHPEVSVSLVREEVLLNKAPQQNGPIDVVVFAWFVGDGSRTVDNVVTSMSFDVAKIGAEFAAQTIAVWMRLGDLKIGAYPLMHRFHLEESDGHPDGEHVGRGRSQVRHA